MTKEIKISPKRHVAKAITWRIVGTIDTIILGWFLTGEFNVGISIGLAELLTKMILYYFHERIWHNIRTFSHYNSKVRHLFKTITWRLIGTIDTIFLGWLISGKVEIGLSIGGLELLTKMLLYYLHERIWYRYDFGLIKSS